MTEEDTFQSPQAVCDGGDLDCGSGLLLIIRNAMQPVDAGGVLEVRSREASVKEDLPAWCRMVGHRLLTIQPGENRYHHYFIRKKGGDEDLSRDLQLAREYEWKVRVRWTEGMKAKAFVRNHSFMVGQPASFDTEDEAPSALEYLVAAVASDLAVGFQWRVSQRGMEISQLEVALKAKADNILVFLGVEDAGHPGLAVLEGRVFVDADGDEEVLRDLWNETVRRSPLTQTILRGAQVDVEMRRT